MKENTVTVDLNHPFAGKPLHFRGEVVTAREATAEEIQGMLNMMSGEGCGCGCDSCGDDCHHDHHGEGHCNHEHKGDGHCGCGGHCH